MWTEGVRSKLSANDSREKHAVSPKRGPAPDFFNGLQAYRVLTLPDVA